MFAGYLWDEETGTYYLMARMYDPETARFLSEDSYTGNPNDPLSLNLYTYCHNNPITYIDPDGHYVRVTDDERKKYILKQYGKYMSEADKKLINKEGVVHFDETKVNDALKNTALYKISINPNNNYKYRKDEKGNWVDIKFDSKKYQQDRESRLYFLKHFARVQANEVRAADPTYVRQRTTQSKEQYSDAESYKKIANYAVKLNEEVLKSNLYGENLQVLDDLLLTIGSSKYSASKDMYPNDFLTKDEVVLKKGDSKYQLGLGSFGQKGFSKDLQENLPGEKDPNNVQHNLLAIYIGYTYEGSIAYSLAFYHERIQQYIRPGSTIGTDQDWESSKRGIALGKALSDNAVKGRGSSLSSTNNNYKMSDLGDLIYNIITYEKK